MEGYNKLHKKLSLSAMALVLMTITVLAILIFTYARNEIKNVYKQKMEIPGKLITQKITDLESINDRDFIQSLMGEDIVYCVIVGTNGRIYYSTSKSLIGKDYWEIEGLNLTTDKKSKRFEFKKLKDKISHFTLNTPLYNDNKELLGYLQIKVKKDNFKRNFRNLFLIFLGAAVVLGLLVYYLLSIVIKKRFSAPLDSLMDFSKELNQGNLSYEFKKMKTGDELEIFEDHFLNFISGLREKANFAIEIEKKNFNYEYAPLSDKDDLGKALVELRNSLQKATEEDVGRKKLDEINSWVTNGVAKFSEILRNDIENIEHLGYSVISNLVEYLGANQGGFYLIDESDNEQVIELKATYALNRKKNYQKQIAWGEGLIGSTIVEGKQTYLTNLPEDYINISSGLGEAKPRSLLIVPLSAGEIKYGAIEIASFKKLEDHQMELVNRITEIIASTISTVRNNIRTQELLKESREQSEKIKQTEEELRQNIEEMHATQEEVERANKILRENEVELKKQAEELAKEQYLMDALMESSPDYIYFKDKDSKFIKNSMSHIRALGEKDQNEMIGKSDFDYFGKVHAKPAFDDEQNIIATGKPIINLIEKEPHEDGSTTWVTTSKMPIRDQDGNIVGTFGISKDITDIKELENEAIESREKLEFENILFTTLMDNIDARITYKDSEAKYLRINKNKVKALGIKDQSEVLGLNDHDIFGDSHGGDFIKKEKANIQEGIESLNNVELIKYKDGRKSWGATSRVPLKNNKGEIIGGMVITLDVTEQENAKVEVAVYNNILKKLNSEMDIVLFKVDEKLEIIELSGKGLDKIDLASQKDPRNHFVKLFSGLFDVLSKHSGDEIVEYSANIEIKKNKLTTKHTVLPNNTTIGGYIGVTVIES